MQKWGRMESHLSHMRNPAFDVSLRNCSDFYSSKGGPEVAFSLSRAPAFVWHLQWCAVSMPLLLITFDRLGVRSLPQQPDCSSALRGVELMSHSSKICLERVLVTFEWPVCVVQCVLNGPRGRAPSSIYPTRAPGAHTSSTKLQGSVLNILLWV